MPVSRRRVPRERPPIKRNPIKALMREAVADRIAEEREALDAVAHLYSRAVGGRLEERLIRQVLKNTPSVFFFAERLAKKWGILYGRPLWASERYGAR